MNRILVPCLAALLVASCSGPIFGGRSNDETETTSAPRDRLPPVEELLALDAAMIPMTAEGATSLRQITDSVTRVRSEDDRVALRRHRGNLVADYVVAGAVFDRFDPARAEWYRAAAGVLVGTDATSAEFPERAEAAVRSDLSETAAANVSCALREEFDCGTDDTRGRVLALGAVSRRLSAWARYGDAALGRELGALCGVPAAPAPASDAPYFDDATNQEAYFTLQRVASACAMVQASEEPITNMVADVVDDLTRRVRATAVPMSLDASFITDDPRLAPPRSFYSVGAPDGLGFTFRRVMLVRTTGVLAAIRPHLSVRDGAPFVPGAEAGWVLPGREVLPFDGPGAIPPNAIVGDTVPDVEAALAELEELLAGAEWMPVEETMGVGLSVGVSVIADGDTYYSTMRPVLRALWNGDYGPIALHTLNAESRALDAVAVRLVEGVAAQDNLVVVREDGYLLSGYDPENLATPVTISRVEPSPLLALHQAIVAGFEEGRLDPDQPLTVRVDDNSVDFGVLAHMLGSVSFARELTSVTTDAALLRAPVRYDGDSPVVLAPRGLRLAL